MPPWLSATLKWVATLTAMALVVGWATPRAMEALSESVTMDLGFITDDLDDEEPLDPEADGVEEEQFETGEVRAIFDLSIRDDVVRATEGVQMPLGTGPGDELLVAFPDPETDPVCLTELQLTIEVIEAPQELDAVARPAAVPGVQELVPEAPAPGDRTPEATESGGTVAGGAATFDVLSSASTFQRLATEANGGVWLVSLRTADLEPNEEGVVPDVVVVAAEAGGDGGPLLEWETEPNCLGEPSDGDEEPADDADADGDAGDPPADDADAGEDDAGLDTEADGVGDEPEGDEPDGDA